MKFGDWLATLPRGRCGADRGRFVPAAELPSRRARALAGAIASIAARRFASGLARDPAQIDANYVRRSDAELLWRDPALL